VYLVSNIEFPATEYEPLPPEVNGVYHEDREVNLSGEVGASQMYRTYNAQFNTVTRVWGIKTPGLPAYATVQNSDGSIHHYILDPDTGLWKGSDNNALYNAVDYGLVPGTASLTQQITNVAAIQAAVTDAINAGGGTVVIPAGTYQLSGTVDIANVTGGLTIRALGASVG
jgi:hypothetical protein